MSIAPTLAWQYILAAIVLCTLLTLALSDPLARVYELVSNAAAEQSEVAPPNLHQCAAISFTAAAWKMQPNAESSAGSIEYD